MGGLICETSILFRSPFLQVSIRGFDSAQPPGGNGRNQTSNAVHRMHEYGIRQYRKPEWLESPVQLDS
jgi:hypothetical protein